MKLAVSISTEVRLYYTAGLGYFLSKIGLATLCAPALQRHNTENAKQLFSEEKLLGLSPNFHISVYVSDLYIPTIGQTILLQENM